MNEGQRKKSPAKSKNKDKNCAVSFLQESRVQIASIKPIIFSREPVSISKDTPKKNIITFIKEKVFDISRILIFLKPEEVFSITLVHPELKKHIENNGFYFKILRIHQMPTKVPLSGVRKLMSLAGNKLRELTIPSYFNSTDTMNIISYIPTSLEKLEIRNINLDYRNIFTKKIFGPTFKCIS